MKRFTFRLERVRELRERAERTQAAELGAAMRTERQRREALAAAQSALAEAAQQAAGAATGTALPAGALRNLELAREAASRQVDAAGERLAEARQRTEQEQQKYGDTRRDLRVVERLKEKRLDAWREEATRDEQKTIDGVALRRHQSGGTKS